MGFLFLLKRIGWFIWDNKRVFLIGLAILVVIIASVFTYRSCGKRKAKLNQQEIIAAQQAIAENDRKVMEKIIVDSEVRSKEIDGNVANAKADTVNAIVDAKAKASKMTNEELARTLEEMAKE